MKTKEWTINDRWPYWERSYANYDDNDNIVYYKLWKTQGYNMTWEKKYVMVGDKNRVSSAIYKCGEDDYEIVFDFYPNANVMSIVFTCRYGTIKLYYDEEGKLTKTEKKVKDKTEINTYSYDDAEESKLPAMFTASKIYEEYVDHPAGHGGSGGSGYDFFDKFSSPKYFEWLEEKGVIVTMENDYAPEIEVRPLPLAERQAALMLMVAHELPEVSESVSLYDRMERMQTRGKAIGGDVKGLKNGLIAVALMFDLHDWERTDPGASNSYGGGVQWTYEIVGAIVDIKTKQVLKLVRFSQVVRDANDAGKDIYKYIDTSKMIRIKGDVVTFFMGDEYHTFGSEVIDTEILKNEQQMQNMDLSGQMGPHGRDGGR